MLTPPSLVRATDIGEFISHHSCERRFKLAFNEMEIARRLPFYYQLSGTVDPVLQEAGKLREREWEGLVRAAGLVDLFPQDSQSGRARTEGTPWSEFAAAVAALPPGTPAFGREIALFGEIGGAQVAGRVDFVLLLWREGRPLLRLVECKASRRDKTYHRVQLALYRILVRRQLEEGLEAGGILLAAADLECVVARIQEENNRVDDILNLSPLDLEMEEADMLRLLAEGGPLQRILGTELDTLDYQLDERCDDCSLHVHCLAESARQRRLELIGIDPSTSRALRGKGVRTLDDLAALDPAGEAASALRADPGFSGNILTQIAHARARCRNLPGGESATDAFPVADIPNSGQGQLPQHEFSGQRLVRVFLSISYDYVENRLGAIAAHVTRSDRPLSTLLRHTDGNWRPEPEVREQWSVGKDSEGKTLWEERPVQGEELIGVIRQPWSGDYEKDTFREAELLQRFFEKLIDAIRALCPNEERAPIHFYVWARSEMSRLVEACARCDTQLLSHLRELLGCRESLEQLIYSCLQDEVQQRFALGWTGRGLVVAASLRWFGRSFHWTRQVGEEVVDLDRVFRQGLFDFVGKLPFDGARPGNPWRPLDDRDAERRLFEIHACFQDALPAPYWRGLWGTLPDPESLGRNGRPDRKLAEVIRRYQVAGTKGYLRSYLGARAQALRWIEEGITRKNADIPKPSLDIRELADFSLGVDDAAAAGLDFLRLEQHVRVNDWIASHLAPPLQRVTDGRTLPLRDVRPIGPNLLEARIDLEGYPISRQTLESRCGLSGFARLTICGPDPARGQTVGQLLRMASTCRIVDLDWDAGRVELAVLPFPKASGYILASRSWGERDDPWPEATLDESISDFVSARVDKRLLASAGRHAYRWFDPRKPELPALPPPDPELLSRLESLLETLDFGKGALAPDQLQAAVEGLGTRVQLLQGPPGTGKTQTTAVAVLLRILTSHRPGDVVLISGYTHTAVDTLLVRIKELLPRFREHAATARLSLPPVALAKADPQDELAEGIERLNATQCAQRLNKLRAKGVVVIGGTPNALLKLAGHLSDRAPWKGPDGFQAPLLIVDEASMMVLPCFLALASLVDVQGRIMLAGDHRQLTPIIAHDWEHEDRPPAVLFQPYVSAYAAVQNLKVERGPGSNGSGSRILCSRLRFTFRLPATIRTLLTRLYRQDDIELQGRPEETLRFQPGADLWESLWSGEGGLFLVTHSDRTSKQSNPVEAAIIREILAAGERLGVLAPASVGLVMPHRAQRSLLRTTLGSFEGAVDVMDTVERLQGGERETIIVSATVSDPSAIAARAEFILSLNRANVAFSRAKQRLVVVCGESLLDFVAPDVEHYAASVLWKGLRELCARPVGEANCAGATVRISTVM